MDELPDIRIGTAEREHAMRRLSDNFAAGRLSVAEFDERSAVIAAAVTRADLDRVFTDLPPEPAAVAAPAARRTPPLAEWLDRAMAAIPIVALILFFVTGSWLWFLAIPLAGALFFGTRHGKH
ncbi:protein of unknown function [Nocardia amikacinitolerans]|uniref:DUF1707 domain-containing protein n=1 Tax=Nocardia amikacinitolerans TaxID=756689 RepID=A0A285LTE9_9NOCA|nr:DUF1707 domain-containing protein [Nocardia amikacinitolerans]MCP2295404.1 protein of unknown function (DUF1707) [Nocardia amikacinitolerans]SNY88165.1 protein of unknown function [Nocardia amikacinitolerans]